LLPDLYDSFLLARKRPIEDFLPPFVNCVFLS